MASPVVVTRIQNRRGTKAQFDALYPADYTGVGGYDSLPGFNATNYPNVLAPGEIALCTDARIVYMGNLSGEYISIGFAGTVEDLIFVPIAFIMPPSPLAFVPLPDLGISFSPVPFFSILYSLTDATTPNWNSVGSTFSRNGELQITALADPSATLTDSGTEINLTGFSATFRAVYTGTGAIEIQYMHNFPTPLIFSTATIQWVGSAPPPPPPPTTYPTFDSIAVTFDSTFDTFDEGP